MEQNISNLIKIIKKYAKLNGFKEYFKDLCKITFYFKNDINKQTILDILEDRIPLHLALEDEKLIDLINNIKKYQDFNMWPTHIINLVLILKDIFKDVKNFEDVYYSLIELLEKLLIF